MKSKIRPRDLGQLVAFERQRTKVIYLSIFLCVLLYFGGVLLGNNGILKYYRLNKIKDSLISEIKNKEIENKKLRAQINSLKEDPFYIEKHAREEFGLAKPDEYIFKFQSNER